MPAQSPLKSAVTFMPHIGSYIQGYHEEMPYNSKILASSQLVDNLTASDAAKQDGKTQKIKTIPLSNDLIKLGNNIQQNKTRIMQNHLVAADYEANRSNLDNLILIRLYEQIQGQQYRWFHLDEMFNTMTLDRLLMRVPFKDNPAAAQKVPRRAAYDTTKVTYDNINLSLEKVVVAYDMPIEDPLRALINPIKPLQESNDFSMAYFREQEALEALQELKYHYTKSAEGAARFTAKIAPANTAAAKISNPNTLTTGNVHSDYKVVNEVQDMRNAFMQENDVILTHFACSPRTAHELAQNTWTAPNTIFNVEAYRTNGGVRPFPGLSDATMVISQVVPDNVLYCASKPNNVLIKAEGPKITKNWEDNDHFTNVSATLDFHQYKCAHEDLSLIKRKFGLIVDLQS